MASGRSTPWPLRVLQYFPQFFSDAGGMRSRNTMPMPGTSTATFLTSLHALVSAPVAFDFAEPQALCGQIWQVVCWGTLACALAPMPLSDQQIGGLELSPPGTNGLV